MRLDLGIPGLSVAVVQNERIIWSDGLGWADLENEVPASAQTTYRISTCGMPVTSFLVMQWVESGLISLDDLSENYGMAFANSAGVRIKHLLSHTSHGQPGTAFRLDQKRFDRLDSLFRILDGTSFSEVLSNRLITPLRLHYTAPTNNDPEFPVDSTVQRYQNAFRNLAPIYTHDRDGMPERTLYPRGFGPHGGWVTSVLDYAQWLIAQDTLLQPQTRSLLYQPFLLSDGKLSRYGMGWFIQEVEGHQIAWHHGWNPPGVSSLVIQDLTSQSKMVLLANSDRLSAPFWLRGGDILRSPAALAFLKAMVFNPQNTTLFASEDQAAAHRIACATHEVDALGGLEKAILWLVYVIQLSALVLWLAGYFIRRKSGLRYGFPYSASRYAAGVIASICLLSNLLFSWHPELLYWDVFPGWVPDFNWITNSLLFLPSIAIYLFVLQLVLLIWMWVRPVGTATFRTHYMLLTLSTGVCLGFMYEWGLIDLTFWIPK